MSRNSGNPQHKRYFVEGYGKDWYVVARNNKTVAKCPTKAWANKVAKLLIEDYERKLHYDEPIAEPIDPEYAAEIRDAAL